MRRPLPSLVRVPHSTTIDTKTDGSEHDGAESDSDTTMEENWIQTIIEQYPVRSHGLVNSGSSLFEVVCLLSVYPDLILEVTTLAKQQYAIVCVVVAMVRVNNMLQEDFDNMVQQRKKTQSNELFISELSRKCTGMIDTREIRCVDDILRICAPQNRLSFDNRPNRVVGAPYSAQLTIDVVKRIALGPSYRPNVSVDAFYEFLRGDRDDDLPPVLDVLSVVCRRVRLPDLSHSSSQEVKSIKDFVELHTTIDAFSSF